MDFQQLVCRNGVLSCNEKVLSKIQEKFTENRILTAASTFLEYTDDVVDYDTLASVILSIIEMHIFGQEILSMKDLAYIVAYIYDELRDLDKIEDDATLVAWLEECKHEIYEIYKVSDNVQTFKHGLDNFLQRDPHTWSRMFYDAYDFFLEEQTPVINLANLFTE